MEGKLTYTAAIAELESIVAKMQSEECDIDRLSEYTRRALELLTFCRERLTKTDEEVKACLDSLRPQS
ncbi:MAG: exodeoxyribonuclease VII small subunit [Bacteroidales bacterium]|nr:exodeoxyribonuclease VII small subunit [Bacteroidales bacterium]MBD5208573.1 exodeoxyribonuclease VII small subunit [Bacteroidales bacterium]MDE6082941.1 exodeoxyribonuclease VII small subunit [Muribaculaceae bacterium]